MDFFWAKLDETCRNSSEYIFEHIESNFSGLRNHPVLQDSRVRHQGHGESWWTFSWQNLMKLSKTVQNAFLNIFKTIFLNQCETGKKIFKTILVVSGIIYTDFHSKIIKTLGAHQMGSTTPISKFFFLSHWALGELISRGFRLGRLGTQNFFLDPKHGRILSIRRRYSKGLNCR